MKKPIFRITLLAACLAAASPVMNAEGSLAIDSNQGPAYGFSYNYRSVAEADQHALNDCGGNCQVVEHFSGECAAYAADQASGSTATGWGKASTGGAAQSRAMSECAGRGGTRCIVRAWGCDNRR